MNNSSNKLYLIVLFLLTISCVDDNSSSDIPLTNTQWTLFKYSDLAGSIIIEPEENEDYWIKFNDDNSIEAIDACNSCFGTFEVTENDTIKLYGLNCTEAGCIGDLWLTNIGGIIKYELSDQTLVLTNVSSQYDLNSESFYFKVE